MIIRNFIPGEEETLREVFVSSVRDLAASFYTPEQINAWAPAVYDRRDWETKLARLRPFVAVLEGQVAGYASLGRSGHIDHFFVSGEFARRGVGSALMRHILDSAARSGVKQLTAEVSLAAESFFSRHGFVVVERQTVTVRGVKLTNAQMTRGLSANKSAKLGLV